MTTLRFDLTPVAWERAGVGRYGHYTRPKTRRFESAVKLALRSQWKSAPLKTAIRAQLTFYMACPSRRPSRMKKNHTYPAVRPDWDNLAKGVCDSANGILWDDDGQLVDVRVRKLYDWVNRKPRIEMEVEEISSERRCEKHGNQEDQEKKQVEEVCR